MWPPTSPLWPRCGTPLQLPDVDYQEFLDIKGIWETGEKLTNGSTNNADG